jgi:hypothetical protein
MYRKFLIVLIVIVFSLSIEPVIAGNSQDESDDTIKYEQVTEQPDDEMMAYRSRKRHRRYKPVPHPRRRRGGHHRHGCFISALQE